MTNRETTEELLKDNETLLISTSPIAVMFGFIDCEVESFKLLKDGSLRLDNFTCPSNLPKMYYNAIIPPNEIYDWLYCNSDNFSSIFLRLKKEAVEKVRQLFDLDLAFSRHHIIGSRFITFVLQKPIQEQSYKQFVDILNANDVRLGIIDEFEARFRYECAQNKKDMETAIQTDQHFLNSASKPISLTKIFETKYKTTHYFESQETVFKNVNNLSKFVTEPKIVQFGTYECKVESIKIHIPDGLQFSNIPQNIESNGKDLDIRIPFTEVELLKLCDDQQIPAIFLKLRSDSADVLQQNLLLKENQSNGFVYNIGSELEAEQYVKVVFNDYFAFQLIISSFRMVSLDFNYLKIEQILISKAYKLLNSSQIVLLRKQITKSNATIFN